MRRGACRGDSSSSPYGGSGIRTAPLGTETGGGREESPTTSVDLRGRGCDAGAGPAEAHSPGDPILRNGGDPPQQYSLRWNDFHSSILSSFRHLREEEDFVDVTLACDGRSFTAHKVVLSACSPYFRRLLKANPCQHPIIILRDVAQSEMEALLRFMYHGEVHVGQEQLAEFLKTAQTLQVRGLADVNTKETHKTIPTSNSHTWPGSSERESQLNEAETPPPSKRPRTESHYSSSPAPTLPPVNGGHDLRDSLLGQALEGGPTIHAGTPHTQKGNSESSLAAHSTGEESNSSDTNLSDRGQMPDLAHLKSEPSDFSPTEGNNHLDSRTPSFPAALLGLQGLPGLLPGPSGMHAANQDPNYGELARRGLDMLRVRATDPRPCPKCGKIYRSAHTLRTHLEDKHTLCPGYRCVLCGTVAKSRNSLHSHMSRQHRGISTKDLPVVPMPAPFDPELASRLLAKAGVKVSASELRARASPTGPRRSDVRLEARLNGPISDRYADSIGGHYDDPEDLSVPNSRFNLSPPHIVSHHLGGAVITKVPPKAIHHPQKSMESIAHNLTGRDVPPTPPASTGSAILDTYLQLIAENSGGMLTINTEQAAAAAAHAAAAHHAKMAALGEMAGLNHMKDHDPDERESSDAEADYSEDEREALKAE